MPHRLYVVAALKTAVLTLFETSVVTLAVTLSSTLVICGARRRYGCNTPGRITLSADARPEQRAWRVEGGSERAAQGAHRVGWAAVCQAAALPERGKLLGRLTHAVCARDGAGREQLGGGWAMRTQCGTAAPPQIASFQAGKTSWLR